MNTFIFTRFFTAIFVSITFYFLLWFGFNGFESSRTYERLSHGALSTGPKRLCVPRLELTRQGMPIWETIKKVGDPKTNIANWDHGWINNKVKTVDISKSLVQNYIYCGKSAPNSEIILFPDSNRDSLVPFSAEPFMYLPSSEIAGKVAVGYPIREFWYLMVENSGQPTAWLQGYEAVSGKPLGYFGNKGHQIDKPTPSERIVLTHYGPTSMAAFWMNNFNYEHSLGYPDQRRDAYPNEYSGDGNVWFSTPGTIQEINIVHRSIREFAKTDGDVQIKLIPGPMIEKNLIGNTIYTGADYMLFAQSKSQIQLLDHNGGVRGKAFAPKEGWPISYCIFADPKNGLSLTYGIGSSAFACPERRQFIDPKLLGDDGKIHQILKHFTPDGKVDIEATLPIEPITAIHYLNENGPSFSQCFSNPLYGFIPFLEPEPFQLPKPDLIPWIFAGALFNLFLIVLMALRQRQFGESLWTIPLWSLLIIVFGLAGWLGYRFHRPWPPLVRCGNCKAKRPCNLAECPKCQAPFAKPQLTGNEIFQDAPTLTALGGI
jgi:hypothetical protein